MYAGKKRERMRNKMTLYLVIAFENASFRRRWRPDAMRDSKDIRSMHAELPRERERERDDGINKTSFYLVVALRELENANGTPRRRDARDAAMNATAKGILRQKRRRRRRKTKNPRARGDL